MAGARALTSVRASTDPPACKALKTCAKSQPVVVTGRVLKAPGLFSLSFDNFEGGRLATQHLLDLGHRRIAFIAGDAEHPDANERLRGYRAALEGTSLNLASGLERLRRLGVAVDEVRLVGGAARNPLWRRVLAASFGCPVVPLRLPRPPRGRLLRGSLPQPAGPSSTSAWR